MFFKIIYRRYHDKEPTTQAPVTTVPRSATPSEIKKPTINVTVNPKSLSSNAPNTNTKSAKLSAKKIDMGAASNFGRDEIGINSPTHRNTHAEEDLFATSNSTTASAPAAANKTDLLDDIFQTCSTTNNLATCTAPPQSNNDEDDFFNPREDESQEFGDFASAFGTTTSAVAPPPSATVTSRAAVTQPTIQQSDRNDSKKTEFADFGSAFTATAAPTNQTIINSNDPANLMFAINSTPNAQNMTSNSNEKVGDLLSDLDGLSLNVSAPSGKFQIQ